MMHPPYISEVSPPQFDPWAVLDTLPSPCVLLSGSGATIYANTAAQQLHASDSTAAPLNADFVAQHSAALRLSPEDRAALAAALHDVLSGARPQAELHYACQIGQQRRWLATTIVAYSSGGETTALVQQHDITARKQAEDQLWLYQHALAAASTGITITDQQLPDQPLIYCNPAFEQITGYSSAETLGRNCRFLQGPDSDPTVVTTIRTAIRDGQPCQVVLKNYRKDGTPFWNELHMSPIRDAEQRVTHFIGVQHDISARKQIEAALHEAEERFRFLSEVTFEGLVIHDQGRIVDANQLVTTMWGYQQDELIGMTVMDLTTPEEHATSLHHLQAGQDAQFQTTARRKDGSTFPMEIHAKSTRYRGRTLRVASVRDISDRKHAEDEIKRAQVFLNSVIENIPLMLLVKDARELRFVRVNKAAEELLGLSKADLIGKSDYDFFPQSEADFFTGKDREVLTGRVVVDIPEEPIQTLTHGERILHTRKIPLLDDQGQAEYLLAIAEDITERKQAEAALRISETRYQRMIANMPGMVYQFALRPDGGYKFLLVSDGVRDVLGLTPAELQNDAALLMNTLSPEDQEQFSQAFHVSATTLQAWQWEGRITHRAGGQRWIQGISRPERQPDGTILWDGLILDITERKRAAEALKLSEMQAETIRVQASVLQELSTPLFPLSANVVMMPLIGTIDSARAGQMTEMLLQGIQLHHARIVIVDITGVPIVDSQVANVLMQAAQAVRLLGAQIVLTGIRPEIAQTLVGLGIDLSGLTTRGSLQSGVAYALERS